ncbi:hypothetical protein HNP60_000627 [Sphingobium sp. B1D3A]|uniref:Uncharacterized protein n=1 Tax=Sphingobium lignivorans TaxID=2735886 RepID=A0ABR6NDR0_9SPHN|nr:hypothetical protein [Sphingobium lignivorans]
MVRFLNDPTALPVDPPADSAGGRRGKDHMRGLP